MKQTDGIRTFFIVYRMPTKGEDDVYCGDGTVGLMLDTPSRNAGFEIDSGNASASVTVKDTNTAPTVRFGENSRMGSINEGKTLELLVSLTGKIAQDVTVHYSINPDTATSGDYVDTSNQPITIANGEVSETISIEIESANNDSEPDETFQVVL